MDTHAHTELYYAVDLSIQLITGMNFRTKGKCSTSKSRGFLTECLNVAHCPHILLKPFSHWMSNKDGETMCACLCVCVSACVHIHKGKLLSTSNRGPNQHPIAHPHNLSLYPSRSHLISIPSQHSSVHPPPPRLLPWDGSRGGEGGKMGVGGRGERGSREWLAQCKLSFEVSWVLSPVLVVMLEGKDKSGRSRIWVPGEQAVTRPLANAMTLLKY